MSSRATRFALAGPQLAFLLAIAHATNDAFANVLPVFLPTLQARLGLGEAALAGFVALISVTANVLQAFAGALADRWGRRRATAVGLILGSVLMSFLAVVPTVWALVGVLACGGLGSAIFHPAAASMARLAGSRKGLAMGLFTAGGPIGTALMPVLVLFILRTYGAAYVPWLAVFGMVLGALLFSLRRSRRGPTPRIARRSSTRRCLPAPWACSRWSASFERSPSSASPARCRCTS